MTAGEHVAQPSGGGKRVVAPRTLDGLFRVAGGGALIALAVTAGALALRGDWWRVPFVIAHVCALIALVPLGTALLVAAVRAGFAARGTPVGAMRVVIARFPVVTALVAVAFLGVAVTLSQFDGGVRVARTVANTITVAAVVMLVVRYLRAAPAAR